MKKARHLMMAARVDDPGRVEIPGSTPEPCSRCPHTVMLSTGTRERLQTDCQGFEVVCLQCAVSLASISHPVSEMRLSAAQVAERIATGQGEKPYFGYIGGKPMTPLPGDYKP